MAQNVFGIDIGTSNIKIYNRNLETIMNEKNMIAIQNKTQVLAVGDEAYEMYEKTPDSICVSYPVKFGVIADIKNMQILFENMIKKSRTAKFAYQNADFCFAVPTDITEVEKRAFYELAESSKVHAKKITVVEKPVADGVGVGIQVDSPKGNMIVNFGADTTEISVISLGGIVISHLMQTGGNRLDENICSLVRKQYNLIIGMKTAEQLKKKLGDAVEAAEETMKVYGRDLVTGLPVVREIQAETVYQATHDVLANIITDIKMILERTPPELAADIIDTGIFLTGGSALFRNFDKLVRQETELKINIPPKPDECVVCGISKIVTEPEYMELAYLPREKVIN
ncbi:MAG: rod shape-determining protein [Lachnospiraceae bacterium]|nr:rod shape-determining protein [Lachnospiraceae bacterium]